MKPSSLDFRTIDWHSSLCAEKYPLYFGSGRCNPRQRNLDFDLVQTVSEPAIRSGRGCSLVSLEESGEIRTSGQISRSMSRKFFE